MDYGAYLRQQHQGNLNVLEQLQRGGGERREIKRRTQALLNRIERETSGRFNLNRAATILYHELASVSDDSANTFRAAWQQKVVESAAQDTLARDLQQWSLAGFMEGFERPAIDLAILPVGAWFLQFKFALATPYISHDDQALYIIDNPVVQDRVFGLPVIRPSSWKGNLRSALRLTRNWPDEQPELIYLFGNSKGTETGFRAGRLEFYPTFFRRIGLEIINPHDRARKVGQNPILIECVPSSAQGTFSLLYVPFDLIGQCDEVNVRKQARQDLLIVAEAVHAMVLLYGFSAKRTSGYGTAENRVENGRLILHDATLAGGAEPAPTAPAPALPAQPLPRYLAAPGQLKPQYLNPDGTFRERTQAELATMRKADRQEYEKAKKWWEREGRRQMESDAPLEAPPPVEKPEAKRALETFNFKSLSELVEWAREIAAS